MKVKKIAFFISVLLISGIAISGPVSWLSEKKEAAKTWLGGRVLKRGEQAAKLGKKRANYKKRYSFNERVKNLSDTARAKAGLGGSEVKIRYLQRKKQEAEAELADLIIKKDSLLNRLNGPSAYHKKHNNLTSKINSLDRQISNVKNPNSKNRHRWLDLGDD